MNVRTVPFKARIALLVIGTAAIAGLIFGYAYIRAPGVEALASCVTTDERGATISQSCVRTELNDILKRTSSFAVLNYIVASSTPMSVVKNCHGIAHAVGETEYRRAGSVEKALTKCTSSCFGGCLHGVVESAVEEEYGDAIAAEDVAHAGETLFKSGAKYCATADLCHGIGHVMYKNFQSFKASLNACSSISKEMNSERCFEGVFMESLGDESSFGFARAPDVSENTAKDYGYPCTEQKSEHRLACFRYLPAFQDGLFFDQGITDPETKVAKQIEVCDRYTETERRGCLFGMSSMVTQRIYKGDLFAVRQLCDRFSDTDEQNACTMGIVSNWASSILTTEALDYCAGTAENERRHMCYFVTFEILGRQYDTDKFRSMCNRTNDRSACANMLALYDNSPFAAQAMQKRLIGTPI